MQLREEKPTSISVMSSSTRRPIPSIAASLGLSPSDRYDRIFFMILLASAASLPERRPRMRQIPQRLGIITTTTTTTNNNNNAARRSTRRGMRTADNDSEHNTHFSNRK
ncbi:hypothetical protein CALCODRAFT_56924 [Calocera cornea HHB12733]|uniref:Uncharacterized protein n=1 Tax=Calocera cornea HHB12733 TaxID=1353952 RepID=A0A165DPU4_9BASI|nr:hypothetical protein CALCODRAFT_56924 [Calocera cornea HHB12733]